MGTIYRRGVAIYSVTFGASTTLTREAGEIDRLSLGFSSETRLRVQRGDYVEAEGERFIFTEEPSETKKWGGEFCYEATLQGAGNELGRTLLMFLDEDAREERIYCTQGEFDLTATAEEFLDLICRNLNRNGGERWTYSASSDFDRTQTVNIGFSDTDCLSALESVCDELDLEWEVSGRNIGVAHKLERKTGLTLSYPESLISPIKVKHEDGDDTCTRLFVFGGERNIPSDYNDGRTTRLMMTGKAEYLQRQSPFVIEKTKVFDDIYPRRDSSITDVGKSASGFFRVYDASLDFDLNKHLTDNPAKISFTSGLLVGYEFEIADYNHAYKRIEIKHQTDGDVEIPNELMCPRKGDKYVLLDIKMPETYILNAEAELYEEAVRYFKEDCADNVSAEVEVSTIWLTANNAAFRPRQTVRLYDADLELDKVIRITRVISYPFDAESLGRKQQLSLADYTKETKLKSIASRLSKTTAQTKKTAAKVGNVGNTLSNSVTNINTDIKWNN